MVLCQRAFPFFQWSCIGVRPLAAIFLALMLSSLNAFADAEKLWVQSSFADVLEKPEQQAIVIARWAINTPVLVSERKGLWCLAEAAASSTIKGYVSCDSLGPKPLTLKDLQTSGSNGELPKDSAERSFWIAPSIMRFATMGQYLNFYALNAEQQQREQSTKTPIRFISPKLEAMKQRLIQGVVPKLEQETSRVNVNSPQPLKGIAGDSPFQNDFDAKKHLPVVKASFFRQQSDVLLLSEGTNPDAVAAMLGQPSIIQFSGKPTWVSGEDGGSVSGFWDIGEIDVQFARPVPLYSVSREGLVGARIIDSTTIGAPSGNDGCDDGYPYLPQGDTVPGYADFKDQPLVSFYLPRALPFKRIDVMTMKILTSIMLHTLDIDQDGIPDIAIMEWNPYPQPASTDPQWFSRIYFFNVAGEWWYAGEEEPNECD